MRAKNVEYQWDNCAYGKGRLCGREDETGSYSYDAYGNLLEERHTIDGVTYTKSYSYDKEDRIARMTLPSGRVVEYSRDNVRRVRGISTEVNGQQQAIVSEISYRADGGRTGYLYGNGLSGQRLYDRQGRLLRQELGVRSAGTWSSKSWERYYQYDKNSNLVHRGPRPDESKQSYGYDALNRLEEERKAGPPDERQVYEYDLNGNRLRESGKQGIEHFLEKGSNRLRATEELLQTEEGEVEESSTSWRYEYNDAGRLKTVYQEGVKVSSYLYGADGLRRKKTVYEPNGSTVAKEIHYHYVSGLLVSETTATGTLLRDYLWNPVGSPLVQIEGSTTGNSQEQLLYLHADHLLTPRRATNATGTSVWSWESSAFGKESPRQDPDGDGSLTVVQLRYPGQYHDAETGLYYNWHRYYDPSVGQYIQSDPIGLQSGLNTYAYVGGNPLMYTDPTGEFFNAPGAVYGVFAGAIGGSIEGGLGGVIAGGLAGAIVGLVLPVASKNAGAVAAGFLGQVIGNVNVGNDLTNPDNYSVCAALGAGVGQGFASSIEGMIPRYAPETAIQGVIVGVSAKAGGEAGNWLSNTRTGNWWRNW